MFGYLAKIFSGILVSCYFFPFEFTFLPGMNTKKAMAAVGLLLFVIELARNREFKINKDVFGITLLGFLVSLCGFSSAIFNGTNDYTYATYVVSMLVWLGGAYTAITMVKFMHGYVSVELICNYLIAVCVAQCAIAILIDYVPAIKAVIDAYVVGFDFVEVATLDKAKRLYGIGAALDVAGTRFSAALVMIAIQIQNLSKSRYYNKMWMYIGAFIIISIVGNMMARTTTVGIVLSLVYLVRESGVFKLLLNRGNVRVWKYLFLSLCLIVPLVIHLYLSNTNFYENIRFAFEGFFSLAEKGYWETNSNNILKNMIVFPDNLHTWLIGDGYIENPNGRDPYYVGPVYGGYYMGTDIGYLRFIFYFGLFGLLTFIIYFFKVAKSCVCRFPVYTKMFWLILLINMIIWLKVSTDIFLVFALFLCISKEENDAYEKEYEDSIPDSLDV